MTVKVLYYFISYAAAAFLLALALTPLMRQLSFRLGAVDIGSGRRAHEGKVPRLGGVAIFASFVIPMAFFLTRGYWEVLHNRMVGILAGCAVIFLVGAYDDIRGARIRNKLLAEVLAAGLIYAWGIRITVMSNPFGSPIVLGALSLPVTLLWVIIVTNAVNLVDGLDGLAAGTGILIAVTFMLLPGTDFHLTVAYAILAGSLAGFLLYNFPPASIFMGDSGSLFLGFFLASMSVLSSSKATALATIMVPVIAFTLPLMDMLYAVVRRYYRGLPLGEADREHIHHKLLEKGFSKKKALFILSLVNVSVMIGVLFMVRHQLNIDFAGLFLITLVALAGVRLLGYAHFFPFVRNFRRNVEMSRRGKYYSYVVRRFRRKAGSLRTRREIGDLLDELLSEYRFSRVEVFLHSHDREAPFYRYAAGPVPEKPLTLSFGISCDGSEIGSVHLTRDMYDDYLLCASEMARAVSEEMAGFVMRRPEKSESQEIPLREEKTRCERTCE